jgi:hypothetical protein
MPIRPAGVAESGDYERERARSHKYPAKGVKVDIMGSGGHREGDNGTGNQQDDS